MKYFFLNLLLFPFVFYCQYTSIPDPVFENVLINYGLDTIQDGQVLTSNISGVQFLDVSEYGISDLTGIEDFTSLEYLDCYSNILTNLDVSNCSNLEWLDCESNFITNLDVSQNTLLNTLWCYENQLQSINVTGCINLEDFEFDNNLLTQIDITSNVNLRHIDAWTNLLSSFDVSNSPNLESLEIYDNDLECLNLKNGNNTFLQELEITNNLGLTCVEVDDSTFSANNWLNNSSFFIGSNQSFSNNCNYSSNCFGITDINENLSFINFYPNPTKEDINISIENFNGNIQTEVYDLIGNKLQTTSETTISLRDYSKGIYILKVAYGERVEEIKVIKD
tara:strand:+ start:158 stop:1165 length:1008 start_codon:yes stop_codon:yes gene_type:complete